MELLPIKTMKEKFELKDENKNDFSQSNNLDKNEDSNKEWIKVKFITWNPNVGESIQGILKNKRYGVGPYKQNLYTLKTDENKTVDIWGRTQLDNLMEQADIGEYIRITFNGSIKTNNNKQMYVYNLEIRK